jgi:hypothetical protein
MRKLTTLFFLIVVINSYSQNSFRVEYFIDNDQGFSRNPYVNITGSDDIVFDKTIFLEKTNEGLHTLFIRVKDNNGNWSSPVINNFICIHKNKSSIEKIEYYIDDDPGYENASNINLETSNNNITLIKTIVLDGIDDGLHTLYVRALDNRNNWSSLLINNFVCIDLNKWKIEEVEYFIDEDPGIDKATKINFSKASKLNLNFNVDVSAFEKGMHTIAIRSKNNADIWSKNYVFNFEIKDNLSITSLDNKNLLAYPSPTTSKFTVELESTLDKVELVITDLTGKVISENTFHNTDKIIGNLTGKRGLYIVYIFHNRKTERIFKIKKI